MAHLRLLRFTKTPPSCVTTPAGSVLPSGPSRLNSKSSRMNQHHRKYQALLQRDPNLAQWVDQLVDAMLVETADDKADNRGAASG